MSNFLLYRIIETGEVFKLNREFQDDRWKNRIVTWMDWSPHVMFSILILEINFILF